MSYFVNHRKQIYHLPSLIYHILVKIPIKLYLNPSLIYNDEIPTSTKYCRRPANVGNVNVLQNLFQKHRDWRN